jgi:lysozyme
MDCVKGIDVSHHQGDVDFAKVKASGIGFAMLRTGYGWENPSVQTDQKFCQNYLNAKKAGLPCGAYHYSYAKNAAQAKLEADFFLKIIKGCQFGYPVAFDLEDSSQANLSREALTDIVTSFCSRVEQAGYYVCLYSNPDWIQNRLDMERLKRFDLWLAHYSDTPGRDGIGMWQYSSSGKVNGIGSAVDLDIAYRDYPKIMKQSGLNGYKKG